MEYSESGSMTHHIDDLVAHPTVLLTMFILEDLACANAHPLEKSRLPIKPNSEFEELPERKDRRQSEIARGCHCCTCFAEKRLDHISHVQCTLEQT
jgi:hypothetical protein